MWKMWLMKMNDSQQSSFSDKLPYDDSIDDEICSICNEKYSDHNAKKAVDCALAVIRGGED